MPPFVGGKLLNNFFGVMKKRIFIFIVSFVLSMVVVLPRGGYLISIPGFEGYQASSFLGFVTFFFLTVFFLHKYKGTMKKSSIIFTIWLGVSIIDIPYRLHHGWSFFVETLNSFPNILIWWFGILCGLLCALIRNSYLKVSYTAIILFLFFFVSTKGYGFWSHKLSFDTFTGKVVEECTFPITFQNDEGENVFLNSLEGTYLIFDFWTSSCGVCFLRFPHVQKVFDKWWDNNNVQVYGVFCRFEEYGETFNTGAKMLVEIGYTFPSLSMDIHDPAVEGMGIKVYPTVLIFNKNKELIFRGNIEYAEKYLDNLMKL